MNAVSRLVSATGLELPLRAVHLDATAHAGLAVVTLRQVFHNPATVPAEVTYHLPLPPDAAVGGFTFTVGERVIVGQIQRREEARRQYEAALLDGRSAGIVEQLRDGLFTQRLGNVPPGAEVHVTLELDQPLAWRDGGWEWRFPTVVAPRYVDGATPDAAALAVDVADAPLPARLSLHLQIRDARTGPASSSSHGLQGDDGHVQLDGGRARLDRDVVVRWPVAAPTPGVAVRTGRSEAGLFARVVLTPPAVPSTPVARDVILLLDTSGSMAGAPMAQLQAVSAGVVRALGPQDTCEIVSFGGVVTRWRPSPAAMDEHTRSEAIGWVQRLTASGGTPMDEGIRAALAGLRVHAQRQVVLMTDGHIGFEQRILDLLRQHLPRTSRLHTVGVGDSVNRGLLEAAARAGGGCEVVLGLHDATGPRVDALLARLDGPQVVDVTCSGDALVHAPAAAPVDLFAGAPGALHLAVRPGTLVLRGRTAHGPWEQAVRIDEGDGGPALARLYGRVAVAWRELDPPGPARDAEVERLGLRCGVVTSRTSLVGVSVDAVVDPGLPTVGFTVAQELPYGMSSAGLGLRAPSGIPPQVALRRGAVEGATAERARAVVTPAPSARLELPAPPPLPPSPAPAGPAPSTLGAFARRVLRRVTGQAPLRLVSRERVDGRLVIVLEALEDLPWEGAARVTVDRAGRTVATLPGTTRATTLRAGERLRLVLDAPDLREVALGGTWIRLDDAGAP